MPQTWDLLHDPEQQQQRSNLFLYRDNFGSVDLGEEISTEVRASKSVSLEKELLSASVENHATTEGTNGPSDEGSAENDETEQSEGEDIAEQDVRTRPQRQRRPP